MILSCPACTAQFSVDPAALGPKGRKVRCGKCGNLWLATPPSADIRAPAKEILEPQQQMKAAPASSPVSSAPPSPAAPAASPFTAATRPPPPAARAEKTPKPEKKQKEKKPEAEKAPPDISRRNAIFGAILLAALCASPVLMLASAKFLRNPAEKETAAVRLDGVPRTLLKEEQGRTVLSVSGMLINGAARRQPVPVLKAQALNAKRGVVREWVVPLSALELEPGQRLPFIFTTPFSEQGVVDIGFKFSGKAASEK